MPVTLAQLAPVALGLAGIGLALALRRAARRSPIEPLGRADRPRPAPLPLVPLDRAGPAVTLIDLAGFAVLAAAGAAWLWHRL